MIKVLLQCAWHFTENQKLKNYLAITLAKLKLSRPVRLGTGWIPRWEYRREGAYFVLSFVLLLSVLSKLKRTSEKHKVQQARLVCEVRRTYNCSFNSLSDRSYFEAAGPNCFNGFCKILCIQYFLSGSFLDRQHGRKNSENKTLGTSTPGGGGYSLTRG